jgi:intraflagellar transport protein 122
MTSNIQKYIEKKDFVNAYKIANLANTEQDLKLLGVEALQAGEFELAKRVQSKHF